MARALLPPRRVPRRAGARRRVEPWCLPGARAGPLLGLPCRAQCPGRQRHDGPVRRHDPDAGLVRALAGLRPRSRRGALAAGRHRAAAADGPCARRQHAGADGRGGPPEHAVPLAGGPAGDGCLPQVGAAGRRATAHAATAHARARGTAWRRDLCRPLRQLPWRARRRRGRGLPAAGGQPRGHAARHREPGAGGDPWRLRPRNQVRSSIATWRSNWCG